MIEKYEQRFSLKRGVNGGKRKYKYERQKEREEKGETEEAEIERRLGRLGFQMIEWFLIGFLCGVLISIKSVRDGIISLLKNWRKGEKKNA